MKVKEITDLINQSEDYIERGNVVLLVRKDNSKTGKSRKCVAPVKKNLKEYMLHIRRLRLHINLKIMFLLMQHLREEHH